VGHRRHRSFPWGFHPIYRQRIRAGFQPEVAFIATTLIAIDITLAALFWSWGGGDDIIARLVKKTLFVGVFAYLIGKLEQSRPYHLRELSGLA